MLKRVDRMLLAVRDREAAADTFQSILGAERVREGSSRPLAARRTVVQAGISEFELLEPSGAGPVAEHLERWGEGIFAVGFSTVDLSALGRHLTGRGIAHSEDGDGLFIAADQTQGMNVVLSPEEERPPVGLISLLYEVTNIVDDHKQAAEFYADAFGLDAARFSPITSEQYGYTGQLTLFNPPQQLDRIELRQNRADPDHRSIPGHGSLLWQARPEHIHGLR
jgi:catechol 2,3-dioxygenase-like lactoylglutathione lyase family enzyme